MYTTRYVLLTYSILLFLILQHMKMLLSSISPAPCCFWGRPADAPLRIQRSTWAGRPPHRIRLPCPSVQRRLSRRRRSPRSAKKEKKSPIEKNYNKFREHWRGKKGGLYFYVPPKMWRVSERRRFPIKSVIPNVRPAVVAQASTVNLL